MSLRKKIIYKYNKDPFYILSVLLFTLGINIFILTYSFINMYRGLEYEVFGFFFLGYMLFVLDGIFVYPLSIVMKNYHETHVENVKKIYENKEED